MAVLDLGKVVPEKGVDYFTDEEITSVENDIKNDLNFDSTIQAINEDISDLQTNKANKSEIPDVSSFIDKNVNDLTYYTLAVATGSSIELSINSSTYVMSLALKNSAGTTISSGSIDLPLETMVVGASYDSLTREIILTLKNGNTTRFSVADLVSGLQTEITSNNKLSSDLVDDTNGSNKFLTSEEKAAMVKKTDYLTDNVGGVVKTSNAYASSSYNGAIYAMTKTYEQYQAGGNGMFIGKGTLENIISGKELTNKTYVDGLIGDIDSALDAINGEVVS